MNETRNCQNCKQSFTIEPDDFSFYEKMSVPPPLRCPDCRQKRRLLFRNFKTLYKRPSDKSGKSVISMYSEKAPFPVWSRDEWWTDDWDARGFGRNVDFNRPILDQIWELWQKVPRAAVLHTQTENCTYSNAVSKSRNCYLVFGCVETENAGYGHIVWNSKESFDNLYLFKSELCFECIDVLGSYHLLYCGECEDCTNSIGLFDCRGCTNCIGCVGLQKKSYYIFNKPVSKEDYEKFLVEHPLNDPKTISLILEKREVLRRELPQRSFFGSHNVDVSGNHIYNAKNIHHSFDVKSGENSKFVFTCRKAVDSYDIGFTSDVELGYEVLTTGAGRNIMFSHSCVGSTDTFYSDNCFNCHNVFASAGLRSNEYCILNKQYSKEEYEKLVPTIIEHMKKTGEWGEFFPEKMSTFAYNESIINEYFPLSQGEAIALGYRWEEDIPRTSGQETVKYEDLPTDPQKFSDELTKQVLKCLMCGFNYKLIPQEITFYKQIGVSLPHECFNCRHARRMNQRNRRLMWEGQCIKCGVKFQTSYSPEQQKLYKIYCESCYQSEVI
jgi:hypothetical protein